MNIERDQDFEQLEDIAAMMAENPGIEFENGKYVYYGLDARTAFAAVYISGAWMAWQAKAQAVPEGFVLVPKEPYAYLIKHKFWQKGSDPEIFLAVDFLGDDGIDKDKLNVCMPLYLGDDETQEPK